MNPRLFSLLLISLLPLRHTAAADPAFVTLAGAGPSQAYQDGRGRAARFLSPFAIAEDSHRYLYVTDAKAATVRRVNPAGFVETLAGYPGAEGSTDGIGVAARFSEVTGIAVDAADNIYVTDLLNHTVRKITPAGIVTTLAGLPGSPGSADGTGAAARFNLPNGLAVDAAGNVFVSDMGNATIRKITPAGVVTTFAGQVGTTGLVDGTGNVARFDGPIGLAFDSAGNLYVADSNNNAIRRITPAGAVTLYAGGYLGHSDGTGTQAGMWHPMGVTVDSTGVVYVTDSSNQLIRRIAPDRTVTTLAGSYSAFGGRADGTGSAAAFKGPNGIVASRNGNLYVADYRNCAIRQVTPAGVVTLFAGNSGAADGTGRDAGLGQPVGIAAAPDGTIFFSDTGNQTIRKLSPAGIVTTLAGQPELAAGGSTDGVGSAATFQGPLGLALDRSGRLYVAEIGNSILRRVAPDGTVTTVAGKAGYSGFVDGLGTAAQFSGLCGVALAADGMIYVTDRDNMAIRRITPAGLVSTLYRNTGGNAANSLVKPTGIAIDAADNLYVTDSYYNSVCRVGRDGTVTRIAGGNPGVQAAADGVGVAAKFCNPEALVVDRAGNLYVADTVNCAIRKVTPDGVVTTLGGGLPTAYDSYYSTLGMIPFGTNAGASDGVGPAARFFRPRGIALDAAGNLVVADSDNATIRLGSTGTSRLANLSARATVTGAGEQSLIAGFVVSGGAKSLLVRGAGPALARYGVGSTLANPLVTLYDRASTALAANDDWSSATNAAQVAARASALGAFAFDSGSKDSALLRSINPGVYSAVVASASPTPGVALAEVYDDDAAGAARLTNLSVRTQTSSGEGVAVAGFVVTGTAPIRILIRGIGPALGAYGVSGALSRPQIVLFDAAANRVASNATWGDDSGLAEIFAQVGAFALPPGSLDAAMVVTLRPGVYSVHAGSTDNASGIVLIELYEVP